MYPDAEQSMDDRGHHFRSPVTRVLVHDNKQPSAYHRTAIGLFQPIVRICPFYGEVCKGRGKFLFCRAGSKLLAGANINIWGLVIILFRAFLQLTSALKVFLF